MPPKRRNATTKVVAEDAPRAGRQSSRNANKVVKYIEVDSDDEEKPKRRRVPKPKEPVESSESNASGADNYDSEEDKKEKTKKVLPAKKRKTTKEPELSDQEEEDDEEDEKKVVKSTKRRGRDPVDSVAMETKRKPQPVKKGGKKQDEVEDEEEEEEEDEEEEDGDKRTPPPAKKGAKKHDEDDDEEEEEDEDLEKSESEDDSKVEKNGSSKNNVKMVKLKPPSKKAAPGIQEKKLLNKTDSDYSTQDFTSDKTTTDGKPWNLKISSWNVGGLKAWIKKSGLDYIKHENPDILCLQETKCSKSKLPPEADVDGYHAYWLSGEKEGYAGIGLYSKEEPIEVKYGLDIKEYDSEGRVITAEYEKFYVVAVYVPNSGRGLVTLPRRMDWDPELRSYVKDLDAKKPVIICGDMNVSHEAIDLANPKSNAKNAGFTQEERDGMTELLKEGFVDSFRKLYPDQAGAYTFWTYMGNSRSKNVGWRLDYFVLSEKLVPALCDSLMRDEVFGSDHCPITLLLHV